LSTKLQPQLPYTISAGRLVKDLGGAPARRDKGGIRRRGRRMAGQLRTSAHRAVDQVSGLASKDKREQARANLTRSVAGSAWAKRRYADAWVLMDRIDQAQDNAEHLYRYLKRKRPGVNAWFVLDRQSADWDRLAAEGFKLVPYGSLEWRALLLNARHVLSSHTSAFASDPLPRKLYGAPTWRFTFLQHGVTKDDLSRWLNPKRFDIIVAATVDEAASFTGDGSPYMFTDKEVRLTGFPRHDALLHLARSLSPDQVDRLLVMPTWRHALTNSLPEALDAEERYAVFRESEYAEQWLGLLNSPALKALADEGGLRITLLPHPNMAAYLRATDVPDWVDVLRWADVNVQDVFARSKLLVTDYTSVAFDIALLDRPVAYFQFDRDAFFSGAQPFRKGYFDYDRDAFGPIAFTQEELMAALHKLAVDDFAPSPEVAERIARAFGERRGDACYQVFKAVSRLDTAVPARVLEGAAVAVASSPGTDVGVPQEAGPGEPLVEVGLPGEVLAFEASTEALIAADVTSEADAVAEAPTPMGPDADPVVVGDEEI
jgi:CDP-glycerol glycerophosphotransferase (TagB/SpsB family)